MEWILLCEWVFKSRGTAVCVTEQHGGAMDQYENGGDTKEMFVKRA
jgi:hypothetical protein